MKKSGAKIIIKPRRPRQPEAISELEQEAGPSDIASEQDNTGQADGDDEGAVEEVAAESDAPEEHIKEDGDDDVTLGDGDAEPVPMPRGRGRGRPRGPSRGGTGRPRGRPRGSGRGRGRGRGRGGTVLLRLPKRGTDSDAEGDGLEGDDSQAVTPGEDGDVELVSGGKQYRKVTIDLPAVEGDAYVSEDDPTGDTKIDSNGNLLGGRVFKAQTFILPERHPERKYLLAIDAARTSGFRDSLYYFRRNPLAYKLNAAQAEKDFLIEQGKLGGHLRTRSVTLVTARSAFKLHGAKMLVDGRIGVDDYYEEKAIAEAVARGLKAGDFASELLEQQQQQAADASAAAAAAKNVGNKAERSGLGLYRTGGPTTVFGGAGLGPFIMAQRTSEANSEWVRGRAETLRGQEADEGKRALDADSAEIDALPKKQSRRYTGDLSYGVYEPHTAIVHYETSAQPTRARWEIVPDSSDEHRVLGGTKVGNGAWALAWVDTVMELPDSNADSDEQTQARKALLQSVGMSC
ncbi:hypothetical protein EW145_g6376 [Phellinidium pouzarii]|uniref:Uncharacterized protein n=1 Tax=Phellinidium pouzarii TaxID=167371 RepID=A0A4S4KXC8_9AGAM|nr:hypothetical protein EW145_g6376 [Phellinidium pouzarii]